MPTSRSDRSAWRRAAVAALLVYPLAACSSDEEEPPVAAPPAEREERGKQALPAPGDVVRGLDRLLDRRAEAVRRGDRAAFLAGVEASEAGFRRDQATYFDNLAQLPVGRFGYDLDRTSMVRDGTGYRVTVDLALELEGFDEVPVVSRDRYLFTRSRGGGFLLASVTDQDWEQRTGVGRQPWDVGPVTVRSGHGVLGIFDAGSAAAAPQVVREVEAGIAAVAAEVPYPWDGRVVVYALAEPAFLAGLGRLPVGDPLALDAVTLPVPAGPGRARIASTRFVLNPAMVTGGPGAARSRLIRHELTHIALGEHQRGVPTWLAEGLAEFVSVQPMAPEDRVLPAAALQSAEKGLTGLPDDGDFRDATETSYAISWWACEYLAEAYDEAMLWILLDATRGSGDPARVLRDTTGFGEAELARKAGRLMVATYRPEPQPSRSPRPSESPGASGSPQDEPSEQSSGSPSP